MHVAMHDKQGGNSGTALHHAATRGLTQMVNLLLSHGAPPISDDWNEGPVHDPTIDSIPTMEKDNSHSSACVICLEAPIEGACIPCGHMAGCMLCLTEVKGKKWGCPVCRTKIDQVVKKFAV
ncbi:hypothetical protein L1887_32618 [Cichorium endivia]|nr:hypothetical protein L1887_32618 [Cichorium endivia]